VILLKIRKHNKSNHLSDIEFRDEFNKINTMYNNKVGIWLSLAVAVFISAAITTAWLSYLSGNMMGEEFWLILPPHLICIAISFLAFILHITLRVKNLSQHWISDFLALVQTIILMLVFQFAMHIEALQIGIKNVNVIIILLFVIGFAFRFRLVITYLLIMATTLLTLILIVIKIDVINNFLPSFVNVIVAGILALLCSHLYWRSRWESFVSAKNLEILATYDELTRLRNRRSFNLFIEQEWNKAIVNKTEIALFMIDIDHFKQYNDFYGHVEGDKCLMSVAAAIAGSVRKNDFTARYGGEEFAIIISDVNNESIEKTAENLILKVREANIKHDGIKSSYVTISAGLMICNPIESNFSIIEFINKADEALYTAKSDGRNRYVIHPDAYK